MRTLILLFLFTVPIRANWTEKASLDRDLTRLVSSTTHLLAYSENKISTSLDGNEWTPATNPGFPILDISKGASGGFVALSFEEDSFATNSQFPYLVTIMDSMDGLNWTRRIRIARALGISLPASGEIVEAPDHFVLTITMGGVRLGETFTLTGDTSAINEIRPNQDQLISADGTIFGEFYNRENTNSDTCLTTGFNDFDPDRPWASWRRTSIYLDLKAANGDLLIGQNGLYREGGEIYYGNWSDLGEIQGYHNGVGLILPNESASGKVLTSEDFLQTWTEQKLPGSDLGTPVDATFFKNHWFVLVDLIGSNIIYSLATSPKIQTVLGDAQLTAGSVSRLNFPIPGCHGTATAGIEVMLPGSSDQLYQLHTSTNLEDWTAYGLPMSGGRPQLFPITSGTASHSPVFFRADEVEVSSIE